MRVTPILIKGKKEETWEYLVNNKASTQKSIAQVHIGEQLAGIPWTETRTKKHIVNEVAQALYKVLVFTKSTDNPLQNGSMEGGLPSGQESQREILYALSMLAFQFKKIKSSHARGSHTGGIEYLKTSGSASLSTIQTQLKQYRRSEQAGTK